MTTLPQACAALAAATEARIEAQRAEDDAKDAVRALMPMERAEGAVSASEGDWKASVTFVVNRTVDQAMVAMMLQDDKFRWAVQRLFPVKFGLDAKEMKFFQSNEPEFYAQLARAITAKPGKPQVKVERVEEQKEAA